jgi:very-short-patch-repair endonuclease
LLALIKLLSMFFCGSYFVRQGQARKERGSLSMVVEYVVFIGLLAAAVVCYIVYELKPKEILPPADPEGLKVESPIERRLYDALRFRGEFVKTQVPCGKYRIDIALPAYHIAIECDGQAYHSTEAQKAHDKRKNAYLRANGWKVLRFSGSKITKDLKGVIARIEKEKKKGLSKVDEFSNLQT